jgi:hypothetical protein
MVSGIGGLEIAKFFFSQSRLFKDTAKRSRRDIVGVHGDINLSAIGVAQ